MGSIEIVRWVALAVLILFSGYTLYCTWKENFWKACKGVWRFHWGRQVTVDLFVGIFLFSFFVFLNESSFLVASLWTAGMLVIGNPVTMLYFVINFESLVRHFSV